MKSFTAAERIFAEYVIKNTDVIYESITLATEHSKTGYGSIIRFCQKLGYSGFQDFKIHLALETGKLAHDNNEKVEGWLKSMAVRLGNHLLTDAEESDEQLFKTIAIKLISAPKIVATGVGGSYPTVLELSYRLSRLGLTAVAEADTHMQAIRCSTLDNQDVVFAVSFSGSTKDILDATRLAKKQGATIVALTNYNKSPLGEVADYILSTNILEGALEAEIGTRLSFFFIIEALCESIYKESPYAVEIVEKTADSVSGKQI